MLIPFVLFGLLLCSGTVQAADWPSWRGPSQNGVSSESDLITEWSTEGDNLIWHANFIGRSTPIVLNGRVFVIGRRGEGIGQEGIVAAFDAKNGEKIWEHAYNIFHTTIPFNRVGWASLTGDPDVALDSIPGQPPDLAALPPGCAFAPRCERAREECDAGVPATLEPAPERRSACLDAELLAKEGGLR